MAVGGGADNRVASSVVHAARQFGLGGDAEGHEHGATAAAGEILMQANLKEERIHFQWQNE